MEALGKKKGNFSRYDGKIAQLTKTTVGRPVFTARPMSAHQSPTLQDLEM